MRPWCKKEPTTISYFVAVGLILFQHPLEQRTKNNAKRFARWNGLRLYSASTAFASTNNFNVKKVLLNTIQSAHSN